jgi:hypothetical protein
MAEPELAPVIRDVIEQCLDKKRLSEGITLCASRAADFASMTEMQLAGIAMVPEARQLMTAALTQYWSRPPAAAFTNLAGREVIIGGGYHAAVYAASRVMAGFPKPVVLERNEPESVGGAFAMSMQPVFWLNSRNRPGPSGLPDQDKGLNFFPAGTGFPPLAMLTSQEYADNALVAWLVRLLLAQFADVTPGVTVTSISGRVSSPSGKSITLATNEGTLSCARVLDARGLGNPASKGDGERILSFPQFMARMGTPFPLRGLAQVAIIGGGNSGLCAAESLLGLAPGHTSTIGLDCVQRVDVYAPALSGLTCSEFREGKRGRYLRLAQYLEGNASSPSTRLRLAGQSGYPVPVPGGVLVNDRTYDLAIQCTGYMLPALTDSLSYGPRRGRGRSSSNGPVLAAQASPIESYRIGPAAGIGFTDAERAAGLAAEDASSVAMFRLGPRTAALATMLSAVSS